jgi:putative transposase
MFSRTFFVTTVTARRFPLFRNAAKARLLMETLLHYQVQRKYELHEFVIMPDHVHLPLTPSPETSLERAVQFIKGGFSYRLQARGTVWQESFTNHRIRDGEDFERHREYIRVNPVEARLVKRPEDYPYSWCAMKAGTDPIAPPVAKGLA